MDYLTEEEKERARQNAKQQGASGFTNFATRFGANAQAAQNQAQQLKTNAENKAKAAQSNLNNVQSQFQTNVGQGSVQANNPNVRTADQMKALSQTSYTGPASIADTANVSKAYEATQLAQDNLNALGNAGGLNELAGDSLSGALVGSAGDDLFAGLRARFTPKKNIESALDASAKTAADAKAQSAKNATEWGRRAELQAKVESDAKATAEDQANGVNAEDARLAKVREDKADRTKAEQAYSRDPKSSAAFLDTLRSLGIPVSPNNFKSDGVIMPRQDNGYDAKILHWLWAGTYPDGTKWTTVSGNDPLGLSGDAGGMKNIYKTIYEQLKAQESA